MDELCEDVSQGSAAPAAPGLARRAAAVWRGEMGQALVEYALVLMLIAMACIVVLGTLGDVLINTYYNRIMTSLPG